MSFKPGIRAAALVNSLNRGNSKLWSSEPQPNKEQPVSVPDFGDKISEVRKQLNVLNTLINKLSSEYDEHVARQVMPARATLTRPRESAMAAEGLLPSSGHLEGQPPKALLSGTEDDVRNLIQRKGLDPNKTFENFRCIGKDFASGTPLAIAVLRGKKDMVNTLIEHGADPDSEYSFIAGAEQLTWSGSAIHAAIPSGNLEILKELVKLAADINNKGSNGANLVWQAAYFNQPGILEHLLESGVEADRAAKSQDNSLIEYTPLHAAAIAGHSKVVQMLLHARAKHTMDYECRQPLEDAIKMCHADVVRQLMVAKSDIFGPVYSESTNGIYASASSKVDVHSRCIDLVFHSANPVMLSQVAQGLSHQSSVECMCKADFIRFLSAPGEAAYQIMDAIFQRCVPRYWDEVDGKRVRTLKTAAYVKAEDAVNIVEGPHYRVILNCFDKKVLLPSYGKEFMQQLLPQQARNYQSMYVPVSCYMCHIPMLHKDLQVLLGMADCKNSQIFSNQGCQAIINLAWFVEERLARFRMLLALVEVLVLLILNLTMNDVLWATVTNFASTAVWLVAFFIETMQMIGYISRGLTKRYFSTARYWFDLVVLLLTGGINISLMVLDSNSTVRNVTFRTVFGVITFLKWMRFLTFLRQFKQIGINILPITTTMWDVVPFGLVLSIYLIGSVNLYYALGINPNLFEAFMLVYRLVVLGDLNVAEFENVISPEMTIEEWSPTSDFSEGTARIFQRPMVNENYSTVVRLFIVFVSFVMGLTMMNLFVAILCLSYSEAAVEARNSFMRSRCGIVLDQRAVRLGTRALLCFKHSKSSTDKSAEYSSATLNDESDEARSAYVWFALQADRKG